MYRRQFLKTLFALPLLALRKTAGAAKQPSSHSYLLNRFAMAGLQDHEASALLRPNAPDKSRRFDFLGISREQMHVALGEQRGLHNIQNDVRERKPNDGHM